MMAAYLSTAAYCGAPRYSREALEAWKCGPACDHVRGVHSVRQVWADPHFAVEASAFIGKYRGRCLVAFRGTADGTEWLEDLRSGFRKKLSAGGIECRHGGSDCWVGSGWLAAYGAVRPFLLGNLTDIGCRKGSRLFITGHSLGGAAAQLAMYDLAGKGYRVQRSYVFGSPRAGNNAWAGAFEERLGTKAVFRVTHRQDPVPHLPPKALGFFDIPTEVFYIGNVTQGYQLCDGSQHYEDCSSIFKHLSEMIARCLHSIHNCDHLMYMTPLKVTRMDGATCAVDPPTADLLV